MSPYIIRNCSIIWGPRQNCLSSFRLIISFTTKVVTVGIKVLKLCFTSEFEISRDTDFEHFGKEFPTVQLSTLFPHSSHRPSYYHHRLPHVYEYWWYERVICV